MKRMSDVLYTVSMLMSASEHPHVETVSDGTTFHVNRCQKMDWWIFWATGIEQESSRTVVSYNLSWVMMMEVDRDW